MKKLAERRARARLTAKLVKRDAAKKDFVARAAYINKQLAEAAHAAKPRVAHLRQPIVID
jgi:hypothetical protein